MRGSDNSTVKYNKMYRFNDAGFTLIEMMVVIAIMVVITGVVLTNKNKFGGQVMLRNLAYEMALALREAQTYGVSVRKTGGIDPEYNVGYGIHFNANTPTQYLLFADTAKQYGVLTHDQIYTSEDEVVKVYDIGRGFKINKICVNNINMSESCYNICDTCSGSLDILFKRPEPDAVIHYGGNTSEVYDSARIELISPRGDLRDVLIEVSGQISVRSQR